ncbi:MAG: glycosyltransferase family 2 protein [Planctomycetota bacterium]
MTGDMHPRADICAIIPCYNEGRTIRQIVLDVREKLATVLVVDDGSTDATIREAEAAGAVVLKQPRNMGKGAALKAGFAWAAEHGFQAALTLDGDGQHAVDEIPLFVNAFDAQRCDIVVGNRMTDLSSMPRIRRWTNRFTSWAISRMAGQKIWDSQCGYRLISIRLWKDVRLETMRFEMESEILIRACRTGAKLAQVTVKTIYFKAGESKINPVTDTIRFLRLLWRCRKAA